ncbi:hypothetical protein PTSG_09524 [Salpingoeca rosetta]|uniref:Uncharacterized protein n=1 Tax=Salpingoeca rosetta (strain ATCC 50818 / BSB-021) TaxID=946362 RepID=F2UL91_SALR5|nr:uncharacterized protein PTSG_09524 [Salpingoeca rosetta]EGD77890.1 hypothetical protein PTSG_09524 [Salpingoeca rosetta]|eukprot:XP_004989954.1 hypothetical protein PTSG_09524 [Salpingoeca rosetta]
MRLWDQVVSSVRGGPPRAERMLGYTMTCGTKSWTDEYHWLSDLANADVQAQLRREERYAKKVLLKPAGRLLDQLLRELYPQAHQDPDADAPADDAAPTTRLNGYAYDTVVDADGSLVEVRRRVTENGLGPQEVVLHHGTLAQVLGADSIAISSLKISPSNKLAACVVAHPDAANATSLVVFALPCTTNNTNTTNTSTSSSGNARKHVRAGDAMDIVVRVDGAVNMEFGFEGGNDCILYTIADNLNRPSSLYRLDLTDASAQPSLLQHDPDPRFFLDISMTKDGKYLTLNANSKTTSEVAALRTDKALTDGAVVLCPRGDCHYFVEVG